MNWGYYQPYVPVAERRAKAAREMAKLKTKGLDVEPVTIEGRKIARTFWGSAWCDHLESFSDYENRLPRGRTYVRNGSVCHLAIEKGRIDAVVSGSSLYKIRIGIEVLPAKKWAAIKKRSAGKVGSLLELLQGKLSDQVMTVVTDRGTGLFPSPKEIKLGCNCPDWAVMCKHVAAVMYGVGARLDNEPELLFRLRGVDHEELIDAEAGVAAATGRSVGKKGGRILDDSLADVFGIDLEDDEEPETPSPAPRRPRKKSTKPIAKVGAKRKAPKPKGKVSGKGSRTTAPSTTEPEERENAITGSEVRALRAKFGMTQIEFALILAVSVPSVVNWEKKKGVLGLQSYSRQVLNDARKITKHNAWRVLKEQL